MTFTRQQLRNNNRWIKSLRNDGLAQAQGGLCVLERPAGSKRKQRRYCCLGVLGNQHDMLTQVKGSPSFKVKGIFLSDHKTKANRMAYLPPDEFVKLTGFSESVQHKLAGLNDDGNTFEEIADHIEQMLTNKDANWRNRL